MERHLCFLLSAEGVPLFLWKLLLSRPACLNYPLCASPRLRAHRRLLRNYANNLPLVAILSYAPSRQSLTASSFACGAIAVAHIGIELSVTMTLRAPVRCDLMALWSYTSGFPAPHHHGNLGSRTRAFDFNRREYIQPCFFFLFCVVSLLEFSFSGQLHQVLALVRSISACPPGKLSTTGSFPKYLAASTSGEGLYLSALEPIAVSLIVRNELEQNICSTFHRCSIRVTKSVP